MIEINHVIRNRMN